MQVEEHWIINSRSEGFLIEGKTQVILKQVGGKEGMKRGLVWQIRPLNSPPHLRFWQDSKMKKQFNLIIKQCTKSWTISMLCKVEERSSHTLNWSPFGWLQLLFLFWGPDGNRNNTWYTCHHYQQSQIEMFDSCKELRNHTHFNHEL